MTMPVSPPRAPSAAETRRYDETQNSIETRVSDYVDDFTSLGGPTTDQMPTVVQPEGSTNDVELGPSGTDASVAPRDLLGGVESVFTPPPPADEAPTTIQHEPRAESVDDELTDVRDVLDTGADPFVMVEDDVHQRPTRRNLDSALGDLDPPPPILPQVRKAAILPVAIEEPSEILSIPPNAPESIPNPPLPTLGSGIGSRGHVMPPELFAQQTHQAAQSARSSKALPLLLGGVALAAIGFFGYQFFINDSSSGAMEAKVASRDASLVIPAVTPPKSSGADDAAVRDGQETPEDAGTAAISEDAAAAVVQATASDAGGPIDAATNSPVAVVTTEPHDTLRIESAPSGAKVYLDGAMVGTTPVDLDPSADQHRLALLLAGYDLYTGDIDGSGRQEVKLLEVTPPGGPAGIKVRCKKKNRYYVFVDGDPVGELCPSERIGVSKGAHVVEIYDPVTDSRRAFNVDIKDTRLSLRLRVD